MAGVIGDRQFRTAATCREPVAQARAKPAAATSPAPGQCTARLTDGNHPAGGGLAPWPVLRWLVAHASLERAAPPCLRRLLPGFSSTAARGQWCGTALLPPAAGRHPAHVFGGGRGGHGGFGTTRGSSRPKAPKRSAALPRTSCRLPDGRLLVVRLLEQPVDVGFPDVAVSRCQHPRGGPIGCFGPGVGASSE